MVAATRFIAPDVNATLTINGVVHDMTPVIDLTVDALSGNDRFIVISVLPSLQKPIVAAVGGPAIGTAC